MSLEFLSEHKVEVTATALLGTILVGIDIVETIGPIDTHQADHRQEQTYTDTGRTLHLEGVEVLRL